jgi:hypothetical protein
VVALCVYTSDKRDGLVATVLLARLSWLSAAMGRCLDLNRNLICWTIAVGCCCLQPLDWQCNGTAEQLAADACLGAHNSLVHVQAACKVCQWNALLANLGAKGAMIILLCHCLDAFFASCKS